jgi:hypothetical protein
LRATVAELAGAEGGSFFGALIGAFELADTGTLGEAAAFS